MATAHALTMRSLTLMRRLSSSWFSLLAQGDRLFHVDFHREVEVGDGLVRFGGALGGDLAQAGERLRASFGGRGGDGRRWGRRRCWGGGSGHSGRPTRLEVRQHIALHDAPFGSRALHLAQVDAVFGGDFARAAATPGCAPRR
jgi:hypothetical protein